ncbi:hypothetical protein QQG55_24785 [Brugia pahangi]
MRWKVVANRLCQRGLPYPFLTCRIVTMKWCMVLATLAIIDPCMDHLDNDFLRLDESIGGQQLIVDEVRDRVNKRECRGKVKKKNEELGKRNLRSSIKCPIAAHSMALYHPL